MLAFSIHLHALVFSIYHHSLEFDMTAFSTYHQSQAFRMQFHVLQHSLVSSIIEAATSQAQYSETSMWQHSVASNIVLSGIYQQSPESAYNIDHSQ
jgi:hypothetical protein